MRECAIDPAQARRAISPHHQAAPITPAPTEGPASPKRDSDYGKTGYEFFHNVKDLSVAAPYGERGG
jgi:hypothetical protein